MCKFCNLSDTAFINRCSFSLSWKAAWLEIPHYSVVVLYSHCTSEKTHLTYTTMNQTNIPLCNILEQKCAQMCTFLLQNGALWGIGLLHCGICELGQFFWFQVDLMMSSPSPPLGLQIPQCEEDGTYSAVQCKGAVYVWYMILCSYNVSRYSDVILKNNILQRRHTRSFKLTAGQTGELWGLYCE